jgi:hypothetical protein
MLQDKSTVLHAAINLHDGVILFPKFKNIEPYWVIVIETKYE